MKKKQADFSLVREKKSLRGKLSKKEKNTKNLPVRLEDQRDPCLVNKKKLTSSNIEREGDAKSNTNLT